MNARLARLQAKLVDLAPRERALILAATLAALYALFDTALLTPLYSAARDLREERSAAAEQLVALEREAETLRTRLSVDVHERERAHLAELGTVVADLDETLERLTGGLFSPQDLTRALRDLLQQSPGVEVKSLATLPAEALGDPEPGQPALAYRHGLELVLETDFASTLDFMERAERLPWRFFWSSLDYRVLEHPRAEVHLRLHTLGSREGPFGA